MKDRFQILRCIYSGPCLSPSRIQARKDKTRLRREAVSFSLKGFCPVAQVCHYPNLVTWRNEMAASDTALLAAVSSPSVLDIAALPLCTSYRDPGNWGVSIPRADINMPCDAASGNVRQARISRGPWRPWRPTSTKSRDSARAD